MTSPTRIGVLIATVALVLAACSSGSATAGPGSQLPATAVPAAGTAGSPAAGTACSASADGSGVPAQIVNFSFPTGLSVSAGQAIAWTNGDSANHTVTLDDGSCSTPVDAGTTVVVTYNVPGTYAFHCSIHTTMTGTIEVK